jgi:hypothetical protein
VISSPCSATNTAVIASKWRCCCRSADRPETEGQQSPFVPAQAESEAERTDSIHEAWARFLRDKRE